MTPAYCLLNGVERNALHPESFGIPARAEREALSEGSIVKIALELIDAKITLELLDRAAHDPEDGLSGERFWVVVKRRTVRRGAIEYRGEITNELIAPWHAYTRGDSITFGPEHILAISEERIPTPRNVVPLRGRAP